MPMTGSPAIELGDRVEGEELRRVAGLPLRWRDLAVRVGHEPHPKSVRSEPEGALNVDLAPTVVEHAMAPSLRCREEAPIVAAGVTR